MRTVTFNVSFPKPLLDTLDRLARQEARSRSEFLREAVRIYVERKQRWASIFAWGDAQAKRLGLKPEDVESRIDEYRRAQRA